MKVSRKWLQTYFEEELPSIEVLAEKITFHAFEIEEIVGDMLDVKVLPDRASYALSHLGIAREIGAILGLRLIRDPLSAKLEPQKISSNRIHITIEDTARCTRYIGTLLEGVTVGPSPLWLKEALESVGSRSINNIVDATNYVMLNLGQPLHAYDAKKLTANKGGEYSIVVRNAHEGERVTTLSGEEYALTRSTLLITDGNEKTSIGIAGVKGGNLAQVDETTTSILIEAAHFTPEGIRKTSQILKLWTDASLRFQNKLSPELAGYAMQDVVNLIREISGGEVVASNDVYEVGDEKVPPVEVTLKKINSVLGSQYNVEVVVEALMRLSLGYMVANEKFTVLVPFYRKDLCIPEDIVEEVGRILGYEAIQPLPLPPLTETPDQNMFRAIEKIKDFLIERGFSEISTQSFSSTGDIILLNPLQKDMPALRMSLVDNMKETLRKATLLAPRVLGTKSQLALFEIGAVFNKDRESRALALGYTPLSGKKTGKVLEDVQHALFIAFENIGIVSASTDEILEITFSEEWLAHLSHEAPPKKVRLGMYRPFSVYPFALRDIAVWTPGGSDVSEVTHIIQKEAGDLFARVDLFDTFEKDGRISLAFRLVLESFERTLTEADIDGVMQKITQKLAATGGFEVR